MLPIQLLTLKTNAPSSGDISNKDDVKRLADEISSKESKGIHLLVNNGMSHPRCDIYRR